MDIKITLNLVDTENESFLCKEYSFLQQLMHKQTTRRFEVH